MVLSKTQKTLLLAAGASAGIGAVYALTRKKVEDIKGLVGYWSFDEGAGDVAYDYSGNNNHGTISGATWTQGISGNALEFNGVNSYVNCGKNESLDLTSMGTIALWANIASYSPRYPSLAGKGASAGWDNDGYSIWVYSDQNVIRGNITNRSESGIQNWVSFGTPNTNEWHHYAFTWNGSNLVAYLDGNQISSRTQTLNVPVTTHNFEIGKSRNLYFDGMIDEVRVYDRALTAQEVRLLYKRIV